MTIKSLLDELINIKIKQFKIIETIIKYKL